MIPIQQTIVDDGKGDCLRACICSLLELPVEDVPNFAELGFFTGLDIWLAEREHRFTRFSVPRDFEHRSIWFGYPLQEGNPEYMLSWGQSPRNRDDGRPREHIVVVQPNGYGVKLAHDPHESGLGLLKYYGFGYIL